MAKKEVLEWIEKYVHPFRITKGKKFGLKDFDPGDTAGLNLEKSEAADLLHFGTQWLAERSRTSSTPKIAGRCCSCSRRWMRPARTAPSNMSCQE